MARFVRINQGFQAQEQEEKQDSFDKVHSGLSKETIVTPNAFSQDDYQQHQLLSYHSAREQIVDHVSGHITQTHEANTVRSTSQIAPWASEQHTYSERISHVYDNRMENYQTDQHFESYLSGQTIETHQRHYQLSAPHLKTLTTPSLTENHQHVIENIQTSHIQGQHLSQKIQTARIKTQQSQLTGNRIFYGSSKSLKIYSGGTDVQFSTQSNTIQTYWLKLNYPIAIKGINWKQSSVTYEVSQGQTAVPYHSILNAYGDSRLVLPPEVSINSISAASAEIIAINNQPVPYPFDKVQISKMQGKKPTSTDQEDPAITANDQVIHATLLPPFILKNLRDEQMDIKQDLLTAAELDYFKQNGNNAVIFIHGFNVPLGEFGQYYDGISLDQAIVKEAPLAGAVPEHDLWHVAANGKSCTITRSLAMLQHCYPDLHGLDEKQLPSALEDSGRNGSNAHNWFVHMEDNLNRATGQFDGGDYRKYTRLIHIAWSGDVGAVDYMESEDKADAAAKRLVAILKQLIESGIEVSTIAHSMGNRVLLRALELLASLGNPYRQNSIEHVFLWDAAVPNTALSNDSSKDVSVKQNCYFKDATLPPKKITVLYSQYDEVLKWAYWGANEEYQASVNFGIMANNYYNPLHPKPVPHDQVLPALGYKGPDMTDYYIKYMLSSSKLTLAPLTKWAVGYSFLDSHSYMRDPKLDIMKHGYQTYIINKKRGLSKFGKYDTALFPDYD